MGKHRNSFALHIMIVLSLSSPCVRRIRSFKNFCSNGAIMPRLSRKQLRFGSVIASLAFLTVVRSELNRQVDQSDTPKFCKNPKSINHHRFLMLVSTLDGRLSALDVDKHGELEWSINTGSGPLLSSSISKLEVTRDGQRTRLIPSLDGGLYQFDGEHVEPVPFNAETLLSSSLRLNDHSFMVGGKQSETYGVDALSGQVKYICDMDGCRRFHEEDASSQITSQTLVLTRTTRTVRAADMATGMEKWNFSVGEHELAYVTSAKNDISEPSTEITDASGKTAGDDDAQVESEGSGGEESKFDFPWWNDFSDSATPDLQDVAFKVIVPKGLIVAVSKTNPSRVLWQYKFDHPIAKAWTLESGALHELDLFDAVNVPALSTESCSLNPEEQNTASSNQECPQPPPSIYIGTHERQLYVQASVQMLRAVQQSVSSALSSHTAISMPTVTWKPYIASSPSRTPAEIRNPLQITWEGERLRDQDMPTENNGVNLWCEYPYDVGYYLFPDTRLPLIGYENTSFDSILPSDTSSNEDFYFDEAISITLWNWWREVTAISIGTAVLLNVAAKLLKRYCLRPALARCASSLSQQSEGEGAETQSGYATANSTAAAATGDSGHNAKVPFASRYDSDFEVKGRIGQGGFGMVSHVQNRIDEVEYAIKRIPLYDSERSMARVRREVKALANLNHPGIVRYHQAWFEKPPPGWQEARDLELFPRGSEEHTCTTLPPYSSVQPLSGITGERVPTPNDHTMSEDASKTMPALGEVNPLRAVTNPVFGDHTVHGSEPHSDDTSWGCEPIASTGPFTPRGGADSSESSSVDSELTIDERHSSALSFNSTSTARLVPIISVTSLHESEDSVAFEDTSDSVIFSDEMNASRDQHSRIPFQNYSQGIKSKDDSIDIIFEYSSNPISSKATADTDSTTSSSWSDMVSRPSDSCGDHGQEASMCHCTDDTNKTNDESPPIFDGQCTCRNRTVRRRKNDKKDPKSIAIPDSECVNTADENTNEKDHVQSGFDAEKKQARKEPTRDQSPNTTGHHLQRFGDEKCKRRRDREPRCARQRIYLYIQMELCERGSLHDWLAAPAPRDYTRALDIFLQIVEAVDYVHQSGLMHRDLKPSNILFARDGLVKMGDFGLVTAVEQEASGVVSDGPESGDSGSVSCRLNPFAHHQHTAQVGTMLYMSPEQIAQRGYSHMVDIFAIGLILFELFHPPFSTQTERVRTLLNVKRQQFPSVFEKEWPQQHELAIELLSPEPETRPTATQILAHSLLHTYAQSQLSPNGNRSRTASRTRTVSTCSSH